MLNLTEHRNEAPSSIEAKRILGSISRFGSQEHQCAYCGSNKTRITALENLNGDISAQIFCCKCGKCDRPSISEETLKLILMHA
jgi:hypothetical protein